MKIEALHHKLLFRLFSLLCFLMAIVPAKHAVGQVTVEIGTGGDTSQISGYAPITRASATSTLRYSRANFLLTAAELSAAGIPSGATITSISFFKGNNGTLGNTGEFAIWMKNSTATPPLSTSTTWASITAGHTQVYNNLAQSLPDDTPGWFEFILQTPFQWAGNNLEVATDWYGVSPTNATQGQIRWRTNAAFADYIVGNFATTAPATLSATAAAYKRRPDVLITYTAPLCIAPPDPGVAQSSLSSVCPDVNFTLSRNGGTSGLGQTYQWQYSTDQTNWIDIPGATTEAVTVSQAENRYYRVRVTCNTQTATSSNTLFVTSITAMNGTYTVNSSNATGGTNFASFADLATRLNCAGVTGPVTVNVQPGTYTGRLVLDSVPGSGAANPIIINGNGQTLTHANTVSAERAAISIARSQYITISNLTVNVANGTSGWGIYLTRQANNITISGNTIISDTSASTGTEYAGIVASASATTSTTAGNNANSITILNNTIIGGQHGVMLVGTNAAGLQATGNVIQNNTIRDVSQDGIALYEQDGALVSGNDISRPNRPINLLFRGIYIAGTSTSANFSQNNTIINNRVHDVNTNFRSSTGSISGIQISGADAPVGLENKVINNMIYNIYGEGTQYGIQNSNADGNHIFHNTIVLDDQTSVGDDARGFYQTSTATNIQFRNNLVYVTRSGLGNKVALYYNTTTSTITSDNNVIWVTPNSPNFFVGSVGTSRKATPVDWQGQGYDLSSAFVDPLFVNRAANNFRPTNAGANDKGAFVGVDKDILNVDRSLNNPDAGAIEWTPAGNDAAISGFIQPVTFPYCGNSIDAIFELSNAGTAILNSVTINWQVNGVPQTPVNLTNLNLLPGASQQVTLGSPAISQNMFYTFSATVSNPNGVADEGTGSNTFTFANWRSSVSGTITVNKNAAASATNFVSVQAAADAMRTYGICGPVMVNVVQGSGPYNEQVTITTVPGGSAANLVTFNGNGETITFNPSSTTRHIVKLRAATDVVVENFVLTVDPAATVGWGIIINRGGSNITVRNNTVNVSQTITGSDAVGISVSDSTSYAGLTDLARDIVISGNTVNGGYIGINAVGLGGSNDRVQNIRIENNTVRDFFSVGIYNQGVIGTTIVGNNLSRPNRPAHTANAQLYGIQVFGPTYNYLIDKNKIHSLHNATMGAVNYTISAINVIGNNTAGATVGYSNGVISNNLIYNITNPGIQYGIRANIRQGGLCQIYHNTLVFDDASYSGTAATSAFFLEASSAATTPVDIRNNIVFISRGGTGTKRIIDIPTASALAGHNFNHNVYWFSGTDAASSFVSRVAGTNYVTLMDWQATGKDINSLFVDPQFTDASTGDFKPTNAVINGAAMMTAAVGVTTDITGAPRNSNPDPGAYEFWPTIYTFIGNGNWDNPANWLNNTIPPSPLPGESEVVINPSGVAILNVPFNTTPGSRITVKAGKQLVVQGNVTIQ